MELWILNGSLPQGRMLWSQSYPILLPPALLSCDFSFLTCRGFMWLLSLSLRSSYICSIVSLCPHLRLGQWCLPVPHTWLGFSVWVWRLPCHLHMPTCRIEMVTPVTVAIERSVYRVWVDYFHLCLQDYAMVSSFGDAFGMEWFWCALHIFCASVCSGFLLTVWCIWVTLGARLAVCLVPLCLWRPEFQAAVLVVRGPGKWKWTPSIGLSYFHELDTNFGRFSL
jgi:hypothetical protein